jgi:hypothetical protein
VSINRGRTRFCRIGPGVTERAETGFPDRRSPGACSTGRVWITLAGQAASRSPRRRGRGEGCRAFGEAEYSALPQIINGEAIISTDASPSRRGIATLYYIGVMHRHLSDEEAAALIQELHDIVESDRYPFSPRIRTLRAILAKLSPEPVREPLPPPKVYAPARSIRGRRRRG